MLLGLQGKFYPDMLAVFDLSTDVVPHQLTNASFTGGYAIVSVLCFWFVMLIVGMLLSCHKSVMEAACSCPAALLWQQRKM